MTSNGYSALVIIAGIGLIGYLFTASPTTAPTQVPIILTALGGFIVLLQKQGDTDKKVEENTAVTTAAKVAASQSIEVSKDNAHAIEVVNSKQDTTNGLVDGHLSSLTAKIDALTQQVARLEHDKLTKAAETDKLLSAITAPGATPPAGTPTTIIAGAPTTIVVDPSVDIVEPAKAKKRPGPGEHQ